MPRDGGLVNRVLEEVESRTGLTVERQERVALLEARSAELSATTRELDLLGWTVLDYTSGSGQEVTAQTRRQWAKKARAIWLQDPQAGAAVDLMNDFVFGRGVPKPRAKDDQVQEVIDEAWDDPDNQLVLTSYTAQIALGTDLALQCNLFPLMFEGEDGKIKLGLLNHDEVESAVRDPDNRLRVLYYLASHKRQEWDYSTDQVKIDYVNAPVEKKYYEHWRNVAQADEEKRKIDKPPKGKMGDGRVFHVALNRTSEQVFGNPSMRRLVRWFSAYNDFMAARVDMAQAAAAFIMRRKVKGTPSQVARMAAKAISRQSELSGGTGVGDNPPQVPPRGGSILTENENVTHENLTLNSNSAAAAQDAQMIRANISAGIRFPQSYLGDATNANLATATSLELPVLKAVEARQEIFEQVFRWFIDRVIEVAVEKGRLDKNADPTPEERQDPNAPDASANGNGASPFDANTTGVFGSDAALNLTQSYEDQNVDESTTERDLSYELSMPSPLRRMMVDLVNSVANIAKTFDPNGTNMELSRVLLTIALGEGLEVQDPADAVKTIFPDGYQDPAIVAAQQQAAQQAQQQQPPPQDTGQFGGQNGAGGSPDQGNPYSAPGMSADYQNNGGSIQQAALHEAVITRGRDGDRVVWVPRRLVEQRYGDVREDHRTAHVEPRIAETLAMFDEDVVPVVSERLTRQLTTQE